MSVNGMISLSRRKECKDDSFALDWRATMELSIPGKCVSIQYQYAGHSCMHEYDMLYILTCLSLLFTFHSWN